MKTPKVRIFKPAVRRRIQKFQGELRYLQAHITALRIDELRLHVPPGHYWETLLEKRILLKKQIAALRADNVQLVSPRLSPAYLFIGSERIRLSDFPGDYHRKNAIWVAISDQSTDDVASISRQAEKVLSWLPKTRRKKQ